MRSAFPVACAVLSLTLTVGMPAAHADPPAPASAPAGETAPPARDGLVEHLGRPGQLATAAERKAALRRSLRSGPRGRALYRLAHDGTYRAPVPVTAGHVIDPAKDPVSFNECRQRMDPSRQYWFKSPFSMCRSARQELTYLRLNPQGVPEPIGTTTFGYDFIGVAQDSQSAINFGIRLTHLGDTDTPRKTDRLKLNLVCANHDPARTSICRHGGDPAGGVEKTVQQWQDQAAQPTWFLRTGITTAVPDDIYKAEMRGYFTFSLEWTLTGEVGGSSNHTPPEYFRCDQATYVNTTPCVFNHVTPEMIMSVSDQQLGESAAFIRAAQTNITATAPGIPGTKVPGAVGETPLTRLATAYDTTKGSRASRRKVRAACIHKFGRNYTRKIVGGQLIKMECDEYPFASTYQNSAFATGTTSAYSYAAMPVPATHNNAGGQVIRQFIRNYRRLDRDPYHVTITP